MLAVFSIPLVAMPGRNENRYRSSFRRGADLLVRIFEGLGAEVRPFHRMERFVAVDTEALDPADLERSREFIVEHGLDAVVSTDGDGDRPLVIDDQESR